MDKPSIKNKKMLAFDLDGTLAETKTPMDNEMAELFGGLLEKRSMAIISGGSFEVFTHQLAALERAHKHLNNLTLFPVTGTKCYRFFEDGWKMVYAEELTTAEVQAIMDGFLKAFQDVAYQHPAQVYGEIIENRGSQVTFSACGQQAPLEVKKEWRAQHDRRAEIVAALQKYLVDFEVKMPGYTSIDVTRKGIDKAYAIHKIEELMDIKPEEIIFVGDALYEGGNDHAVIRTGATTVAVGNPEETKTLLRQWIKEISS
jgi:HAD superfamily hydrolase (TIGR01484 family)